MLIGGRVILKLMYRLRQEMEVYYQGVLCCAQMLDMRVQTCYTCVRFRQ